MRLIGLLMLFAVSTFAQVLPAVSPAVCAPETVSFKLRLDKSHHVLAQPQPGKALVYFIQEDGVTTSIGLDGTCVGANNKDRGFVRLQDYFNRRSTSLP